MPYLIDEEGEMIYESAASDVLVEAGSEADPVEGEGLEVAPSDAVGGNVADDMVVSVVPFDGSGDVSLLGVGSSVNLDNTLIYTANVTGYGDCKLVFAPDVADFLAVTDTGELMNWDNANVVGRLYVGDIAESSPQNVKLITLLGHSSTNYASNWYRYGSDAYVTTYEQGSGSTLSSTQTYVDVSNVQQSGYSYSFWLMCLFFVAFGILAFNGLRRLLSIS